MHISWVGGQWYEMTTKALIVVLCQGDETHLPGDVDGHVETRVL
jgi:hypothetical protein